jgi:hypothetical protein
MRSILSWDFKRTMSRDFFDPKLHQALAPWHWPSALSLVDHGYEFAKILQNRGYFSDRTECDSAELI